YFDSCTLSAHKFYGPKGVGIAYISPTATFHPFFPGATHQNGMRPGTVDVPGIVAATTAADEAILEQKKRRAHAQKLFDQLRAWACHQSGFELIDGGTSQSPFIAALTSSFTEGQYLMLQLNQKDIAISTGTACKAGEQDPSRILLARGLDETSARRLIRLSFSHTTTDKELEQCCTALEEANHRLAKR
ncbi:aminotransferase class V-fold PLP-dependent enzyme, partial [Bacillaceae bacterium SIJ1]|uniref:aminotransferase class V-fold PLP-dependent enzyme n=1 Tax=Litoribacterium kuwaitense TaxID=1398745 RepID=UPI0013EC982F